MLAGEGVWVEPASAAGLAGLIAETTKGSINVNGKRVVVVCTGHGLKDPSIVTESFGSLTVIPATYDALISVILTQ